MQEDAPATLAYKRARFVTELPRACLYTPSHCWLREQQPGTWRIGLTKFATRMLGEMVDYGFETSPGAAVSSGLVLGWIEGFKAVSDLFCVAEGKFMGHNPGLESDITVVNRSPLVDGWLYEVEGRPDSTCVDAVGYALILDRTIDGLLEKGG